MQIMRCQGSEAQYGNSFDELSSFQGITGYAWRKWQDEAIGSSCRGAGSLQVIVSP